MWCMRHFLLACLLLHAAAAFAQANVATVRVPYVRDPVDKSYRKMLEGMDRFARDHALAPAAGLRFRLYPRLPGASLDGVSLRVAGDTVSLPVALDDAHSFVLPRSEQALREDAAVVADRKSTSMTWRAWVQTPGLPPGTRRLGDLRLECRVGMDAGLVSNPSPLLGWLTDKLTTTDDVCGKPDGSYLFFAERPVFNVRLRSGARVEDLPFAALYAGGTQSPATLPYCDCQVLVARSYYAPIWDPAWPDDTLLEFDFMEAAP
jgi:hypothetical protein